VYAARIFARKKEKNNTVSSAHPRLIDEEKKNAQQVNAMPRRKFLTGLKASKRMLSADTIDILHEESIMKMTTAIEIE